LINNIDKYLAFKDDAEQETLNYIYRHNHLNKILGAWRWEPLFLYRKELLPIIFKETNRGIDFGGGAGPISLASTIVDLGSKDIFFRDIIYNRLSEIEFNTDYIFSSHTLEHIKVLPKIMSQFQRILKNGGNLILLLPSYSCHRWRAGNHTNKKYIDHQWTFKLSDTQLEEVIPNILQIDTLVEEYFKVIIKEYSGDNCIFIFATTLK